MLKKHPAESGGILATAVAMLIAQALGVNDADTVMYIAVVVAGVPAAITWLVEKFRKPVEALD